MSIPKPADPARLVVSVIVKDIPMFGQVFPFLERLGGPVDIMSRWLDFDFTSYYRQEMGEPLFRRLVGFRPLISQTDLADIKHDAMAIEHRFSVDGCRRVNVDPGYLLASRFVLATGKDYAHRIGIGRDIYADLTLMYTAGQGFVPLAWTYPDYRTPDIRQFLEKVRSKYLLDMTDVPGEGS